MYWKTIKSKNILCKHEIVTKEKTNYALWIDKWMISQSEWIRWNTTQTQPEKPEWFKFNFIPIIDKKNNKKKIDMTLKWKHSGITFIFSIHWLFIGTKKNMQM